MKAPKPPSRRLQRVAELLKREVSDIIRRELSVDQVGLLNINEVSVAADIRSAIVFIGFVGTQAQRAAAPEKLQAHAARIQLALGSALRMKWTPTLQFVLDDSIERGNRILSIIEEIEKPASPGKPPSPPPHPAP